VQGVPTSTETGRRAKAAGIELTTLDAHPQLDLTIDGADEFDPALNLIKGGGGHLLREKVVAAASREMAVIVDSRKQVERLGAFQIPVEVLQFGLRPVIKRIEDRGGKWKLREADVGQPLVTDEGNYIIDCDFGLLADPCELNRWLNDQAGIVEHGLFIGIASKVLIGGGGTVRTIEAAGGEPS
jgi:ribose 5-phosphate isomerase A